MILSSSSSPVVGMDQRFGVAGEPKTDVSTDGDEDAGLLEYRW